MMALWKWFLFIFLIGQRLIELKIAAHNERWMKRRGGIEKGKEHYKWFVLLHIAFFMMLSFEANWFLPHDQSLNKYLLMIFILLQIGRVWCIWALGKFWNTKIIVIPGVLCIKKGPYKYLKHPNYLIVGMELFIIPLLFQAYLTAIVFPLLHLLLLKVRIPEENRALSH